MTSFQLRALVQYGDLAAVFGKLDQQLLADVGVSHLTAAEADSDLAPVAFRQKLLCVSQLYIEVVDINAGGHANFLHFHHALILAGFLLALGLLEPILAVIHEFAHGGDGIGGDLDQIQTLFLGQTQRLLRGHDAQLFTGIGDQSNLLIPDFFVGLMTCVSDGKAPPDKIKCGRRQAPAITAKQHRWYRWSSFHVNPLALAGGEDGEPCLLSCALVLYHREMGLSRGKSRKFRPFLGNRKGNGFKV